MAGEGLTKACDTSEDLVLSMPRQWGGSRSFLPTSQLSRRGRGGCLRAHASQVPRDGHARVGWLNSATHLVHSAEKAPSADERLAGGTLAWRAFKL